MPIVGKLLLIMGAKFTHRVADAEHRDAMSILRTSFFIGLVIVLLPSDEQQQSQLQERLANASHWAMTFCDRNPLTCERAQSFRQSFVEKAQFGSRLLIDAIWSPGPSGRPVPSRLDGNHHPTERLHHRVSLDTLTRDDLAPAWRGER